MAFNYYPMYTYPQYPQYPQQYQQQQQPQTTGILWVGSEAEAQSYPVAPNNAVALWDSTKPAVYLKQADASGKPTMKTYQLSEYAAKTDPLDREANYVHKEDLDEMQTAIAALKAELKTIKRELKKKEVDTDDE